jgi:hypothetical protein
MKKNIAWKRGQLHGVHSSYYCNVEILILSFFIMQVSRSLQNLANKMRKKKKSMFFD